MELIITEDREFWDKLVMSSPHGTIFHTWDWLKIIEKHCQCKLYPFVGFKGTTPVISIPLFQMKKGFIKMVFSPPPHMAIPFLGQIIPNSDDLKQNKFESTYYDFSDAIDAFLKSEGVDYVNIVTPPDFIDGRPFLWNNYDVIPQYNYIFDLKLGKDTLWRNLKKQTRKNITRAIGKGITTEIGARDELKKIYQLLIERYSQQEKKSGLKLDYLLDLYDNSPDNFFIVIAKYDGKLVGGLINLLYGDNVMSWIGNTKSSIKGYYPNDLLIWQSIEYACKKNFLHFIEIGANTRRLTEYKSNFNPNLLMNLKISKKKFHVGLFEKLYMKYRNLFLK